MSRTLDPYAILGIDPRADDDAVKRAYRRGVLAWHPDVNNAPDTCEKLRQVQWAWEMIGEPDARRGWDAQVARQRAPAPKAAAARPRREHFWSRRRPQREPLAAEAHRARDLFIELELTADEAARGMVVPIEVPWRGQRRTFEIVVPPDASHGATATAWLEEGRSQLHVTLRVV